MNRLAFLCGVTKRRARARITRLIEAKLAVASRAWKEQLLWKKMQHCPMTRPPDGVELRCFLVGS
jgi:hypothetical protein